VPLSLVDIDLCIHAYIYTHIYIQIYMCIYAELLQEWLSRRTWPGHTLTSRLITSKCNTVVQGASPNPQDMSLGVGVDASLASFLPYTSLVTPGYFSLIICTTYTVNLGIMSQSECGRPSSGSSASPPPPVRPTSTRGCYGARQASST